MTLALPNIFKREKPEPPLPEVQIAPYQIPNSPLRKIQRKFIPYHAKRMIKFEMEGSIVSFTFDDFPLSAIENGARILESHGWRGTYYASGGLIGADNHHGLHYFPHDIRDLQRAGHEIGCHTYHHMDLSSASAIDMVNDLRRNRECLRGMGVRNKLESFAWPYGTSCHVYKHALSSDFRSMRGVQPGVHCGKADLNLLKAAPLYTGEDIAKAVALIESLRDNPGWLIFFTHEVTENPSKWGMTPDELELIAQAVALSGADVLTVGDGLRRIEQHKTSTKPHEGYSG